MKQLANLVHQVVSPEVKARIETLDILNRQLQRCIGEALATHCRIANFRDLCLLIHTDSSVWHSKLRFLIPKIQTELCHPRYGPFTQIKIRIHSCAQELPAQQARLPRISPQNARLLQNMAMDLDDPRLRRVFKRLSQHTE